jgi:hypothetical protein
VSTLATINSDMSRAPPSDNKRDQHMSMQQPQSMMMMQPQSMMMQQPMMQQPMMQQPMMQQPMMQQPMMQQPMMQQPMMQQPMMQQPAMQQPMMQQPMMQQPNAMNVIDFKQDVVNGLKTNTAASDAGMGSAMQPSYMPATSFMANGAFMQPYQNFQQPMLELQQPVAATVATVGERYGNDYYKTKAFEKKERKTSSKLASAYPTIPKGAKTPSDTISREMVANIVHSALRDSRLV